MRFDFKNGFAHEKSSVMCNHLRGPCVGDRMLTLC